MKGAAVRSEAAKTSRRADRAKHRGNTAEWRGSPAMVRPRAMRKTFCSAPGSLQPQPVVPWNPWSAHELAIQCREKAAASSPGPRVNSGLTSGASPEMRKVFCSAPGYKQPHPVDPWNPWSAHELAIQYREKAAASSPRPRVNSGFTSGASRDMRKAFCSAPGYKHPWSAHQLAI